MKTKLLYLLFLSFCSAIVTASEMNGEAHIDDIPMYLEYSGKLSSSGQPLEKHFPLLADQGFEQIIYLALTTNNGALKNEDELVLKHGMEYVHIAVDFSKPSRRNFESVAALLNGASESRSLVHCQVNYRASVFSFLYRVIYLGVPIDEAKKDMDSIWMVNAIWYQFIVDTLNAHGLSHECETCDWQAIEPE